ncbi:hypothetical protein [Bradyrhizobium sp. AZCC 1678]|uniref:hypothetical protein n=1 Tax=Bradyrhizobium sp. AZCC 1678 TaxID=3117030 RepID=UPI002FF33B38
MLVRFRPGAPRFALAGFAWRSHVGACPAKLEQRESEDGRAFAALDADDISEEEWRIIEERAARCDLVSDEQVEAVFSRYRNA